MRPESSPSVSESSRPPIRAYPALLHHTRTNVIHCSIGTRVSSLETTKELSFDAVVADVIVEGERASASDRC